MTLRVKVVAMVIIMSKPRVRWILIVVMTSPSAALSISTEGTVDYVLGVSAVGWADGCVRKAKSNASIGVRLGL